MKSEYFVMSAVLAGVLAVAGCKKDVGQPQVIELPEGQLHMSMQWIDGELWVETLDIKSRTCLFTEYRGGKPVESKTVSMKKCRTGLGIPAPRPVVPSVEGAAVDQPAAATSTAATKASR